VVNTEKPEHDRIEARSRELFEESVERLDARTRSRLTQARNAALEELQQGRSRRARWMWAPAGGLAAAAAVAFLLARPGLDPAGRGAPPLEDLDSLAGVENIELLQDVEFYAWLAEQPPQDPNSG
jgi:hypothetical protein